MAYKDKALADAGIGAGSTTNETAYQIRERELAELNEMVAAAEHEEKVRQLKAKLEKPTQMQQAWDVYKVRNKTSFKTNPYIGGQVFDKHTVTVMEKLTKEVDGVFLPIRLEKSKIDRFNHNCYSLLRYFVPFGEQPPKTIELKFDEDGKEWDVKLIYNDTKK